jgi:hypothetical protein
LYDLVVVSLQFRSLITELLLHDVPHRILLSLHDVQQVCHFIIGAENILLGLYIKIIFACIYSSYVNQLEGSKYRIMVLFIFSRFFVNMKTWIVLIWDHQFILIQEILLVVLHHTII